jgi:hypothetical protein
VLDVLPHPNDYVPAYGGPRTNTAYGPQNTTSWGGNILLGSDGRYHLFVSAMGGGRGLSSWISNSQIDHGIADDPMDSFEKVGTALEREAHNASPIRAQNGSWLLFHIGYGGVHNGSSFVHHSESPDGPWLPLPGISCNNPAPMLHNNGTMYCVCNSGGVKLYRSADVFTGGWELVTGIGIKTPPGTHSEDPYLWMDSRDRWHLLAHTYDYRDGWPVNPAQTMPVLVASHGFSEDGVEWSFNLARCSCLDTTWFAL